MNKAITIDKLKEEVDEWIKYVNRRITEMSDIPAILNENTNNIQHNYELIYELKNEIENLKQEMEALKLIHIIHMKYCKHEKKENNIIR